MPWDAAVPLDSTTISFPPGEQVPSPPVCRDLVKAVGRSQCSPGARSKPFKHSTYPRPLPFKPPSLSPHGALSTPSLLLPQHLPPPPHTVICELHPSVRSGPPWQQRRPHHRQGTPASLSSASSAWHCVNPLQHHGKEVLESLEDPLPPQPPTHTHVEVPQVLPITSPSLGRTMPPSSVASPLRRDADAHDQGCETAAHLCQKLCRLGFIDIQVIMKTV